MPANKRPAGTSLPSDKRDMTKKEWCAKHHLSLTSFYNLRRKGLAPDVVGARGGGGERITQEQDRAWERLMSRRSKSAAARREAQRLSKLRSVAGHAGAASPLHHCRRKRRQG